MNITNMVAHFYVCFFEITRNILIYYLGITFEEEELSTDVGDGIEQIGSMLYN